MGIFTFKIFREQKQIHMISVCWLSSSLRHLIVKTILVLVKSVFMKKQTEKQATLSKNFRNTLKFRDVSVKTPTFLRRSE